MIYARIICHPSLPRFIGRPWSNFVHVLKTTTKRQQPSVVFRKDSTVKVSQKLTGFLFALPICVVGGVCFHRDKFVVLCTDVQLCKDNAKLEVRTKQTNVFVRSYQRLYKYLTLYFRLVRLTITFLPVFCLYPLASLFPLFHSKWLHLLLYAVEISGPTFIKLGQWASTRRDIFSSEFCDCFSKLHHHAPPHSWFYTKRKLEKAFGKKWREIFVKIDNNRKAIKSGCIGQVYKGYMKPEKIADESLLEELLEELEESDAPDFFEGLEILGFGRLFGTWDKELDQAEKERIALKREKGTVAYEEKCQQNGESDRVSGNCEEVGQTCGQVSTGEGVGQFESQSSEAGLEQCGAEDSEVELGQYGAEAAGITKLNYPHVPRDQTNDSQQLKETPSDDDLEGLIPVAIKVRHPRVYRCVSRDMKLLYFVASVLSYLPGLKWLSLREIVEEFDELLKNQVDLRVEAKNLDIFNENFSEVSCIKFPKPIRPYVKKDIIVETFEEGECITKYILDNDDKTTGNCTELRQKLAEVGVDALLKMVFVDNFVHADLHPGNILVQGSCEFNPEEQTKLTLVDVCDTVIINVKPVECPIKLIFLDTGIVSTLAELDRQSFQDVFTAVVLGDGKRVAELFLHHTKSHQCEDVEKFKEDMSTLVSSVTKDTLNLGKIQVGILMHDVFNILRQHKVKLESNFASMLLAIMVLEGLGRSLNPKLDIMQSARAVLLPTL
ncbi:putative aarF domain-containing protein kinase 2 [Glandiceps talaboti]